MQKPRRKLTDLLAFLITLSVTGCTGDEDPLNPQQHPLLQRSDQPALATVIQRSGEIPPRGIIDVKSTGLALLDVDSDGVVEILLTSGSTADRFRTQEDGFLPRWFRQRETTSSEYQLEALPGSGGIAPMPWTSGVAAADLDGDGDDDLLLTGVGSIQLLENVEGKLVPVADSGLVADGWSSSAAFGDLDLDGDLDLFLCRYLVYDFDNPPLHGEEWSCLWENQQVLCGPRGLSPLPDLVFENVGGLHFKEVTEEWGFEPESPGYGLAVTIIDLHGDPHPEIFVANDSCPNHLWSRSESGRWNEDGLLSGIAVDQDGQEQAGMGIGVGDLDGDGALDLVVTNFEKESLNLYLNQGDGTYRDEASSRGLVAGSRSMLSWGVGVADLDLDGLVDIFVANGHVYPQADDVTSSPGYLQQDQYWLARKEDDRIRFVEQIDEEIASWKHLGRCAVLSDLDRDGDVDILSTSLNGSPHLLINRASERSSSVTILLQQDGLNRQGLGSSVGWRIDDRWIPYPVLRQSSFQSSGEAQVILATGPFATIDLPEVEVRWPDGQRENFTVPRSGSITLQRGTGTSR